MKKTYIALQTFTGEKSLYKGQVIEMEETTGSQLVKDGLLGEYYESEIVPVYNITEMGVGINDTVNVDATNLFNDLKKGIVKIKFDVLGNNFDWNVLGIEIKENGNTFMEFSGIFLAKSQPVFIQITVYTDTIVSDVKLLSATDFSM